jgi:predicted nucleic acid-binding protein
MILVDSSVWIDFFRDGRDAQSNTLAQCLGDSSMEVGMADLVLFEVMRGFREGRLMREAQALMSALPQVEIGGTEHVLKAAERYRQLRKQGRTVRSPIDVLLASYCMTHGHTLLHRDADFESLKTLGGLDTWPQ